MPRNTETEIKLIASPAMLQGLRDHPALAGPERTETLRSTWFDTATRRLAAAGASLRIRETEGGPTEQTLKLDGAAATGVRRHEWTVPHHGDRPSPAKFPRSPQARLAQLTEAAPLHAFAVVEVARTVRLVQRGRSEIEIAFDIGQVSAGERRLDICELELELVKGRVADLTALAGSLPLGPDLRWSMESKARRGLRLAFDLLPEPRRAADPPLRPLADVREGFHAIGWECLGQLIANTEVMLECGDPEAVHQARVAIRRLRVALKSLRSITPDDTGPVLDAELKAAGLRLGTVRDVDVLLARVRKAPPVSDAASADLLAHLAVQRGAAMLGTRAMLAGAPFQQLLVAIAAWLEAGEWRKAPKALAPLADRAAKIMARGRRRLRKQSADLAKLKDEALHQVRKDAKTLRYFAEFLAALHRGRPSEQAFRAFGSALADAQDDLGSLQDIVAARHIGETAFASADPLVAARLQEELHQLLDSKKRKTGQKLKSAQQSLQDAWDAGAWWRADRSLALPR